MSEDDKETILDGLDKIHEALTGDVMDEETFDAAEEATSEPDVEEDAIEANWEPYAPPEEWEECYDLYQEYKNDPITDEARWPNMGSSLITLELIRWLASAATGDRTVAKDISVAVPKVDISKAIYFDNKGSREQIVMLRDGIAIRSATMCRYLTMGKRAKTSKDDQSSYMYIMSERIGISSHIKRYIESCSLSEQLTKEQKGALSQVADSLWAAAEAERAITSLSPYLLITPQTTYAADVHARTKYNMIKDAGLVTDDGYIIDNASKVASADPLDNTIAKLVDNKLFRFETYLRDVIAETSRQSFPLRETDDITRAVEKHIDKLEDFIASLGKSSSHVDAFMNFFISAVAEIKLDSTDIDSYKQAMADASQELAQRIAEAMSSQIESMMNSGSGGRPSTTTIDKASKEAAKKLMQGVDDWESSGEDSKSATRTTHSGDSDTDEAKASASDQEDMDDGRNPAAAGGGEMGNRNEGLQNDFEWTGPDLTIKPDHSSSELMLIPKISSPGVADSINVYKEVASDHKEYIRSTMRYISAILDDETGMFIKTHQEKGKIDPNRVAQYWRTDEIFRTFEHIAGDRNYAIALVVDGSGSMSGDPIRQATAGAVVIGEAIDDLEIPFSVIVYNSGYVSRLDEEHMDIYEVSTDPSRPYVSKPAPPGTFSGGGIINTLYKSFSDGRMSIADKCRLGYMVHNGAGGCNDDAYAIRFATNLLHQYKDRQNKIMIVLADGYPAGNAGGMFIGDEHYDEDESLKRIVKLSMRSGIHIVGLGIAGCDLSAYYPISQTIDSLKDIPATLGELLKDTIRNKRRF